MKTLQVLLLSIAVLLCAASGSCQNGPTQHSVALSWTQSMSTGVTSNCVYRSATSGGPYGTAINAAGSGTGCSATPITTFTDLTVSGGKTYYYVVTALAGATESAYSSEGTAAVPASPLSPASIVVTVK